jgi:hypothetical protein
MYLVHGIPVSRPRDFCGWATGYLWAFSEYLCPCRAISVAPAPDYLYLLKEASGPSNHTFPVTYSQNVCGLLTQIVGGLATDISGLYLQ